MSIDHARALLLTGPPGVGKTTALRAAARALAGVRLAGFWTEEVRVRGARRGFVAVTLEGARRTIASVDRAGPPRVGTYGVDVPAIDALVPALAAEADAYLVDEIGKMECLSAAFVVALRRLLDQGRPLVATVAARGGDFIAEVKSRADVALLTVTRANRDEAAGVVARWVRRRLAAPR